ncbi:uncharacterized protein LOC129269578 isoform X2 [Lytechinus pictus]|uniref:uncharacterized protein LOC129269578 isoform X2 n=1 Tax=Lytechinus pictus TaxID=7653 RepID=UPI0030BA2014
MQHRLIWKETTGTSAQDTHFNVGENADAELSEKELEPGEVCESVAEKSTNRWIRKEAVKVPDKTMMSSDVAMLSSDSDSAKGEISAGPAKKPKTETSGPAKKPKTEMSGPAKKPIVKMSKTPYEFDISAVLEKAAGGQSILGELEEGGPQSASNRRRMVRIVVSHLMEKYGDKPSAEQKVGMAISMIQQFPALKDVEGPGYEAWYTPAVEGEHAKGFIEERLKNVRKRMPKQGWTSLEPSSSSEENQKEPSTKEKI